MKTSYPTDESVLLKIAKKLNEAQQELDELALQLSLGKAEASDKFEEIKKEFAARLTALKQLIKQSTKGEAWSDLTTRLSGVESELVARESKTQASFEIQKEKIIAALLALEKGLKSKFVNNDALHEVVNELEKFKLKLEILRLRFTVKKFEIKDGFRSGMDEARDGIRNILTTAKDKWDKTKDTYNDYRDEIIESYDHLRKAIKKI
ncbi:hypothetical protein WSM22_41650 [Cytophagales bacterium WSM2-2]|nr:hypothetical protein WSM22_41650 [Cytophagales bacterium WSM2-2]